MPKYTTPAGRADLNDTTDDFIEELKKNHVGIANIIGAKAIAQMYDIKLWQAHTVAFQARAQLRPEDAVLCARPGPNGGFFIAETEEEARLYGLLRFEDTVTVIDNVMKDMQTALRGVVQSAPSTEVYWKRTRRRLTGIAEELDRVRHELALAAGQAAANERALPSES